MPGHVDLLELRVERRTEVLPHLDRDVLRQDAEQQPFLLRALLLNQQLDFQALPGLQKRTALLKLRQTVAASTQNTGAGEERQRQDLQGVFTKLILRASSTAGAI